MKDRRLGCLESGEGAMWSENRSGLCGFAVCVLILLTAVGCDDTHSDEYREFSELEGVSEGELSAPVSAAVSADFPESEDTSGGQATVPTSPTHVPSEATESAGRDAESSTDPKESDAFDAAAAGTGAAAELSVDEDADADRRAPQPPAASDKDMDASAGKSPPLPQPAAAQAAADGGIRLLVPHRQFRKEGAALRVSFDDLDLLKILNMDPVPRDAADHFPDWLRNLNGKRVRIRGYMRPGFEVEDITEFLFVRDNGECCYGPLPKIYDMIAVQLADGESTSLIEGTPFDVEGVFRIDPHADEVALYALFFIDEAVIIE